MKGIFSFKDSKIKLASVIRADITLLILVIFSFAIMVAVSYFFIKDIVEKQIFANVQESLNTAEVTIRSELKEAHNGSREKTGDVPSDIDFPVLSSYVIMLHFAQGGYGMLCDSNLNLIIHPSSDYMGKNLSDINADYAAASESLKQNPDAVYMRRMAADKSAVIVYRRIHNGWYLGVVTPVSSYYHDVNFMAVTLSVLGFIFMVILSLILIRLSLLKARSDEQNQGKSSFLARMSHEIRTPMNSILGMAELIRRKAVTAEVQEFIEIIHQSGNNLLSIINDILDFSKIESGRLQLQNRDYEIASVINDMINMMRSKIAEKSLDFFVDVGSGIPAKLYGDDMRLRQILTNLLSNSIKYTKKGFISFDMQMERGEGKSIKLICSVSDSGIGIKKEDRTLLFNEFVRIDNTVNRGIEGTGLGLVITTALCNAMGGEVTVTSEYGKGSTFKAVIVQEASDPEPVAKVVNPGCKKVLFHDWRPQYARSISNALDSLDVNYRCSNSFRDFIHDLEYDEFDFAFVTSKYAMDCISAFGRRKLPLQLVIMAEPGEMSGYQEVVSIMMPVYSIPLANILNNKPEGNLIKDKSMRIKFAAPEARVLIVDDISTNIRVAKELMSPYNMAVDTCLSGSEALNMVQKNTYDIVFMDHMMPGMDGIEAAGFIRNLETGDGYYKNLPIIAFTANAVSGQKEMFLENEINDFLAKPIDIQKLNDILEQWLPAEKQIEVSQPGREETKAEKKTLPVIEGLDVEAGIKNCRNSFSFYISILEDFCKDTSARLNKISEAFANNDRGLYITLVHAIKGAAGNVGAVKIAEDAFTLEKAAAIEDFPAIKDRNTALLEYSNVLCDKITNVLKLYHAKNNKKHSEIEELNLDKLKKALSEMDIEAVNNILLAYSDLALSGRIREIISEMEQLILMFEYDKAIEKIDEMFK